MARRQTRRGAGFSLFDMQDVLRECTDKIAEVLSNQGVDANVDQLFLEMQMLAKRSGENNGYGQMAVSPMLANSEESPYSFSGDILSVAHDCFKNGAKKDSLKLVLQAMDKDDFGDLISGILLMNSRSEIHKKATKRKLQASDFEELEDDEEEDEEEFVDPEDEDTTDSNLDENGELIDPTLDKDGNPLDNEDDTELTDEELEALAFEELNEDEIIKELEKGDNLEEDQAEADAVRSEEEDEEDEEELPKIKGVPMGSTTSNKSGLKNPSQPTPPIPPSAPITASATSRIFANKLSLSGNPEDTRKAREFLRKNPNL